MAIGLFGLDECEHGMLLPNHLFAVPDAVLESAVIKPSGSRLASPVPLELDTCCLAPVYEHDCFGSPESCGSAHTDDTFDEPAWFSEGADSDLLLSLPSPPLSAGSVCRGSDQLSFIDSDMCSPTSDNTDATLWSNSDGELSDRYESPISFLAMSPRRLAGKRERDCEPELIPSGEAICAALEAAVPAIEIDNDLAERAGKKARTVLSRTSSSASVPSAPAVPVSFANTLSGVPCYGFVPCMYPVSAIMMGGMYGAPAFSRTSSSASTVVMQPFSRTSSAGFSRTSSAAFSRTSSSASTGTSRRGENVKGNPQMQKTARDGQKHWHEKCQQLRCEAEEARTTTVLPQFQDQRQMCTARNLKCQKESLLIFLQRATQQGLISPLAFVHPGDESGGFVGWTGFQVQPGCGDEFRTGVEALFPEKPKLNTLYHLFRRSGLVPEDWRRAWDGEIAFHWNPNRLS